MAKKLLLLVEDNPLLMGLYKAAFREKGVEIEVANDGKTGLDIAKRDKPDLIVLDILMVGMSGLEVLEALRKDDATKDIGVVILTIVNKKETIEKAKALGVKDYLIKSELKVDEIVKAVTAHL